MSAPTTSTNANTVTPGAAPMMQTILAQTRAELTMAVRRGESLLVTIVIPTGLLIVFMGLPIVPGTTGDKIAFLLPGILAAAIMSTSLVSLGIATGYDRYYGSLKRLGSTPLPRWGLIVAKIVTVLAVEAAQTVLLVLMSVIFFGWRPDGSLPLALLVMLIGTAAFAGLGMLMAGTLRAEATLAGANGLFLLFVIIGGVVLPLDHWPGFIQWPAQMLPAAALSDALRSALSPAGINGGSLILLLVWAIVLLVAAALTFKWE
ncbi:MAG TPA: ABC transporter permease [Ktedonobacterales bacterium]|nr:ABC transporter permease [Ktedonobacterales bacterium]